jgi:phenolic acid decarboxylase
MFLLVVVLGQTIQRPKETWTDNTTPNRNMDRQYNDQKKHGQTIQRPKETWTDNITTKRSMDRQYNDQKKHGQTIQLFLLVVVLPVHVSFGRCIVCPCFFWSLYCLSMLIQRPKETWTDNITTKRSMDRQYNDQKKHGQTIQLPKETWTDNTTTKSNMDRQYNDQKKHGSMFLLVVVLPVHVSFGRCIACPCFFWSLYCLFMLLLVVV